MTLNYFITGLAVFSLTACASRQSQEGKTAGSGDSVKAQSFFSTNEEIYIVKKISGDTVDPAGNPCRWVELKNVKDEIFESCFLKDDPVKIGDSLWVGHNASGEPYVVRLNYPNASGKSPE